MPQHLAGFGLAPLLPEIGPPEAADLAGLTQHLKVDVSQTCGDRPRGPSLNSPLLQLDPKAYQERLQKQKALEP